MKHTKTLIIGLVLLAVIAVVGKIISSDNLSLGNTPNVEATDINNNPVLFAKSDKHRLIAFWATSCIACIEDMPELQKLQRVFNEKLEIVAVAMFYDPPERVKTFINQNKYDFVTVIDTNNQVANGFGGVSLVPTNFLVNKNGQIILKKIGVPNFEAWQETIQKL